MLTQEIVERHRYQATRKYKQQIVNVKRKRFKPVSNGIFLHF